MHLTHEHIWVIDLRDKGAAVLVRYYAVAYTAQLCVRKFPGKQEAIMAPLWFDMLETDKHARLTHGSKQGLLILHMLRQANTSPVTLSHQSSMEPIVWWQFSCRKSWPRLQACVSGKMFVYLDKVDAGGLSSGWPVQDWILQFDWSFIRKPFIFSQKEKSRSTCFLELTNTDTKNSVSTSSS